MSKTLNEVLQYLFTEFVGFHYYSENFKSKRINVTSSTAPILHQKPVQSIESIMESLVKNSASRDVQHLCHPIVLYYYYAFQVHVRWL